MTTYMAIYIVDTETSMEMYRSILLLDGKIRYILKISMETYFILQNTSTWSQILVRRRPGLGQALGRAQGRACDQA